MNRNYFVYALTLLFFSGCWLTQKQKRNQHEAEVGITAVERTTDGETQIIARGAKNNLASVNRQHDIPPPTEEEVAAVIKSPEAYEKESECNWNEVMNEAPWWQLVFGGSGILGLAGWFVLRQIPAASFIGKIVHSLSRRAIPAVRERHQDTLAAEKLAGPILRGTVDSIDTAVERVLGVLDARLMHNDAAQETIKGINKGQPTTVTKLFQKELSVAQNTLGIRRDVRDIVMAVRSGEEA